MSKQHNCMSEQEKEKWAWAFQHYISEKQIIVSNKLNQRNLETLSPPFLPESTSSV
jgi:hypothetical protein